MLDINPEIGARIEILKKKPFYENARLGHCFPPGWIDVIERMVSAIEELPSGHLARSTQQKEKFGLLRCYITVVPSSLSEDDRSELMSKIYKIVSKAEDETSEICIVCGKPGHEVSTGWIKYVCDEHDKE